MASTYYWLGDQPAEPLVLVPARDGDQIDLSPFTSATADLQQPNGVLVTVPVGIDADVLNVELPLLDAAGLSWLRITLHGAGVQNRLDAVPIIVMDDADGWHTLPSARAEWPDAVKLSDRRLFTLLEVARGQVLAYAPEQQPGTLPPVQWRLAQIMQARNVLNASRVDPSGSAGGQDFTLTPFPLDWTVKQLLRPQRGLKAVR